MCMKTIVTKAFYIMQPCMQPQYYRHVVISIVNAWVVAINVLTQATEEFTIQFAQKPN